jgi:hypothetical protein
MSTSIQTSQKYCHACHKEISYDTRILRTETCPWCRADLHVCLNCMHHDPSRYNECKVPTTERVRERDKANHCGDFAFRDGKPGENAAAQAALNKAAGLFKF